MVFEQYYRCGRTVGCPLEHIPYILVGESVDPVGGGTETPASSASSPSMPSPGRRSGSRSPLSSPWMRRYRQVGFSAARRRTSARTPAGMTGRPGRSVLADPAVGDELAVPAQDRGGCDSCEPVTAVGREAVVRGRRWTARSVQLIRSRGTRPCSTARSPRRVSDRVHKVRVDQLPDQGPLNHGGDRALNRAVHTAVHTIAMTRMRCCPKSRPTPPSAPPSARPPATLSSGSHSWSIPPGRSSALTGRCPGRGRDQRGPVIRACRADIHLGLLRRTCALI